MPRPHRHCAKDSKVFHYISLRPAPQRVCENKVFVAGATREDDLAYSSTNLPSLNPPFELI